MSYTVIENFINLEALENVLANMYHDMEWNYNETSGNIQDMVDDLDPRVLECLQLCLYSLGWEWTIKNFWCATNGFILFRTLYWL